MMHLIDKMGGIATFGIFSICLFVVVFAGSLILAFCLQKTFLKNMGALPLEDERDRNKNIPIDSL